MVPNSNYMDKFLATHIDLELPDRDHIYYRDDIIVTEELLNMYYNHMKSTENTSKSELTKHEYSKFLLGMLTDMNKFEVFFDFIYSNDGLRDKHILQPGLGKEKTEKFRQDALDSIVKIIFREGTPFYIRTRQQQQVSGKTNSKVSHIISATKIDELMKPFNLHTNYEKTIPKFISKEFPDYDFRSDETVSQKGKVKPIETQLLTKKKFAKLKYESETNPKLSLIVLDIVLSRKSNSVEERDAKLSTCNARARRLRKTFKSIKHGAARKLTSQFNYIYDKLKSVQLTRKNKKKYQK